MNVSIKNFILLTAPCLFESTFFEKIKKFVMLDKIQMRVGMINNFSLWGLIPSPQISKEVSSVISAIMDISQIQDYYSSLTSI